MSKTKRKIEKLISRMGPMGVPGPPGPQGVAGPDLTEEYRALEARVTELEKELTELRAEGRLTELG